MDSCFVVVVGLGRVVVGMVENFGEDIVVVDVVVEILPVVAVLGMRLAGVAREPLPLVVVVGRFVVVVEEQRLPLDVDDQRFAREEPHQSLIFAGRFGECAAVSLAEEEGSEG